MKLIVTSHRTGDTNIRIFLVEDSGKISTLEVGEVRISVPNSFEDGEDVLANEVIRGYRISEELKKFINALLSGPDIMAARKDVDLLPALKNLVSIMEGAPDATR